MEETTRINLTVDKCVPDLLKELAGGERKKGPYLSRIIRELHAGRIDDADMGDREMVKILVQNLHGRVRVLEGQLLAVSTERGRELSAMRGRVDSLEATVAAMMAKGA